MKDNRLGKNFFLLSYVVCEINILILLYLHSFAMYE